MLDTDYSTYKKHMPSISSVISKQQKSYQTAIEKLFSPGEDHDTF